MMKGYTGSRTVEMCADHYVRGERIARIYADEEACTRACSGESMVPQFGQRWRQGFAEERVE